MEKCKITGITVITKNWTYTIEIGRKSNGDFDESFDDPFLEYHESFNSLVLDCRDQGLEDISSLGNYIKAVIDSWEKRAYTNEEK